jgi:hypothetical protein
MSKRRSRCCLSGPSPQHTGTQVPTSDPFDLKKKKGKKNKDSKKNVSSNVGIDGFENTDANL